MKKILLLTILCGALFSCKKNLSEIQPQIVDGLSLSLKDLRISNDKQSKNYYFTTGDVDKGVPIKYMERSYEFTETIFDSCTMENVQITGKGYAVDTTFYLDSANLRKCVVENAGGAGCAFFEKADTGYIFNYSRFDVQGVGLTSGRKYTASGYNLYWVRLVFHIDWDQYAYDYDSEIYSGKVELRLNTKGRPIRNFVNREAYVTFFNYSFGPIGWQYPEENSKTCVRP